MRCIQIEVHTLHIRIYSNFCLNLWLQRILYYALISLSEKLFGYAANSHTTSVVNISTHNKSINNKGRQRWL